VVRTSALIIASRLGGRVAIILRRITPRLQAGLLRIPGSSGSSA
jgi:uncharacterized membrane protein